MRVLINGSMPDGQSTRQLSRRLEPDTKPLFTQVSSTDSTTTQRHALMRKRPNLPGSERRHFSRRIWRSCASANRCVAHSHDSFTRQARYYEGAPATGIRASLVLRGSDDVC